MTNRISSHAFIGEGVQIGTEVSIGPGAVLLGPTVVEDGVWIGAGAQIGAPPEISTLGQNAAWTGEIGHAGVLIRQGAVIREGVVIHQGSHRTTTVGEGSWMLNRSYLAHDVVVGNQTTISGGASIGGHCLVGSHVNIGMNVSVHQRRIIADGAMVGMGTPVTRDIPPFSKVYGTPPRFHGLNQVGLERQGVSEDAIRYLHQWYLTHGAHFDVHLPPELSEIEAVLTAWSMHDNLHPIITTLGVPREG